MIIVNEELQRIVYRVSCGHIWDAQLFLLYLFGTLTPVFLFNLLSSVESTTQFRFGEVFITDLLIDRIR